uniref:patatin-like phospholipase family protein n=1 Tax=Thaumasiovibrio subtropicus TaxID=1891207 RepID=UPI00192D168C|nr:patatin-like phospholipase family protein [Thaumasiovibrio subtropicus]
MRNCREIGAALLLLILTGCATPERHSHQSSEQMAPMAVEGIRFWDEKMVSDSEHVYVEEIKSALQYRREQQGEAGISALALSGGGVNGAFSAGILNGWTERGDRPEFDVVTGISTGAIVSIYAFLGSDYDEKLTNYYTQTPLESMFRTNRWLKVLSQRAFLNTQGFEDQVRMAIDEATMSALAAERAKGRLLIIGTTNLDNQKLALWDIGRIAQLGTPEAQTLVQDLVIASSSIPGAFPAKLISVTDNESVYQELHVDGGISRQVVFAPQWFNIEERASSSPQHLYVIRNGRLISQYEEVGLSLSDISERSISTLILNQGIGDVEHIYHFAQHHEIDFHLAHINEDFNPKEENSFTPEYMWDLYDYGFQKIKADQLWQAIPPSLSHREAP